MTLRFIQGLGLGGEWGGAVLMTLEHGAPDRRGLNASWPQVGVPVGNLRGILECLVGLANALQLFYILACVPPYQPDGDLPGQQLVIGQPVDQLRRRDGDGGLQKPQRLGKAGPTAPAPGPSVRREAPPGGPGVIRECHRP